MRTVAQAKADRRALWNDIRREERKKAREKLAVLREQLREARARRKESLRQAVERCRAERLLARERVVAMRERALAELREATRLERQAARDSCAARKQGARAIGDDIGRARAELEAEKLFQRDMRRIEKNNRDRQRHFVRATVAERRGESDDEVRANISPDLVWLFERVKRSIKATPRMSRTEAFLKYCEEHPHEVLAAIDDKTDALVAELERQHDAVAHEVSHPRRRRACSSCAPSYAEVPF